jgi:hypothetical protein
MSATDRTQFDPQNNAIQGQQNQSESHGSMEPDDSRNVTGASGGAGVGSPGGSDQQSGGERWGGGQQGQSTDNAGGSQAQGEQVDFEADPSIESGGEEVAFDPAADLTEGQQSQSQGQQSEQYGERASGENTASDQQSQFETGSGGQMGGGQFATDTASRIREHMEVIGADGVHLGTVDKVEGDRIKLTKADSGMGGHQGHHHYISCGLIAGVEGDKVRLSATAANAYGMEEEE